MTPSLQQAIKLLQMTRMELEGVLTKEMEENPLLEEPEDDPAEAEQEQSEERADQVEPTMDDIDLDAYFNDYLDSSYESQRGTYEPGEAVPIENTIADVPDLYDHLLWQIHMMDLEAADREIAELIIGNLDEDGFLVASVIEIRLLGATPQEVEEYQLATAAWHEVREHGARNGFEIEGSTIRSRSSETAQSGKALKLDRQVKDEPTPIVASDVQQPIEVVGSPEVPGYSREAVERAISLVQSLDPPGICCRSLQESLLCQLRAAGEEGSVSYRLVDEFWEQCLRRQFPAIAKEMNVPLQDLKEPSELIGTLETRPGRLYGGDRTHYVEPDVYVVKVGGKFVVQVNDDGLPRLRVSKAYRRMLRQMKADGENTNAQQYIKEKMRSALWLIKSIDQRQRTIYKVAESIIKQQSEFFEKGIEYLRPMVLRDVADDIEMHESTVSRVVANKYIHTPRGLYPMKFFFHSGIDRDMGEDISSLTVKRKIQHLIDAEDHKKPLSDSALMKRLKAEGIQIARRTVAKYRDELRIPSSTDRKQVF